MEGITLHISLPTMLRDFVVAETAQGSFRSPEEYVTAVRAAEQKRRLAERLEEMAEEGVSSGPSAEMDHEFWQERRRRIEQRRDTT